MNTVLLLMSTIVSLGFAAVVGGTSLRLEAASLNIFYLLELLVIVIIFIGFLRSREVFGLYRLPVIHGFRRVADD